MEPESLGVRSSSGVGVGDGDGVRTLEIMLLHTELPPLPTFCSGKVGGKSFFSVSPFFFSVDPLRKSGEVGRPREVRQFSHPTCGNGGRRVFNNKLLGRLCGSSNHVDIIGSTNVLRR